MVQGGWEDELLYLYSGQVPSSEVEAQIPVNPAANLLRPGVVASIQSDPSYFLRELLARHDLLANWTPESAVLMCHGEADR